LNEWYTKNLGINIDEKYGLGIIPWSDRKTDNGAATAWKSAEDTTQWFGPSKADFMINYTVDNMADIFERLKANKANILEGPGCHEKRPEAYENGKFLWVLDPDGNKVELWEPKKWDPKNKEDCAISSD
jgi:catechol 2,3-dioxygenase-like lactoylglutathione lyase family enzyme